MSTVPSPAGSESSIVTAIFDPVNESKLSIQVHEPKVDVTLPALQFKLLRPSDELTPAEVDIAKAEARAEAYKLLAEDAVKCAEKAEAEVARLKAEAEAKDARIAQLEKNTTAECMRRANAAEEFSLSVHRKLLDKTEACNTLQKQLDDKVKSRESLHTRLQDETARADTAESSWATASKALKELQTQNEALQGSFNQQVAFSEALQSELEQQKQSMQECQNRFAELLKRSDRLVQSLQTERRELGWAQSSIELLQDVMWIREEIISQQEVELKKYQRTETQPNGQPMSDGTTLAGEEDEGSKTMSANMFHTPWDNLMDEML